MLIIEKILNKKLKGAVLEKRLNRYSCVVSDNGKSILTLEELTNDSFILSIDNELIVELHHRLGVSKDKISEVVFQWFKTEFEITNLSDVKKLFD